jgi:serine protease Do
VEGAPNFRVSKRPFLGVYTESNNGKGVRISRIVENSPAASTGLMKDDVLTEVDGNPVNSPDELTKVLADKEVDHEVMLTIIRNGNSMKQAVKLGTRNYEFGFMDMNEVERIRGARIPEPPRARGGAAPEGWGGNQDGWFNKNKNKGARLGVTIQEMENYDGLKVIGIESNSLAERNGILLHDVIVKFDGKKVNDTKMLQSLVKDNIGEDVTIQIKRNKKKKKLTFKIE